MSLANLISTLAWYMLWTYVFVGLYKMMTNAFKAKTYAIMLVC